MNLVKIEFKKNMKGTIIWGTILAAVVFLYAAFYPSMSDQGFSELLKTKLDAMPEGLMESFGLADMPDFSIFMEYYCYVLQFIIIGLVIYAMILGTKSLCMEEGRKTIEFLYAKPITRTKIVLSKMFSSIVSILIVSAMITFVSIICDYLFSDGNNTRMILIVNAMMLIPVFVYWIIGFVISSFLKDDNKSIVIALGLFFGTYLIGMVANTIDQLDMLKYLSPINYNPAANVFKYFDNRNGAELNIASIILSSIIFVFGIATTYIRYNKKDLLN